MLNCPHYGPFSRCYLKVWLRGQKQGFNKSPICDKYWRLSGSRLGSETSSCGFTRSLVPAYPVLTAPGLTHVIVKAAQCLLECSVYALEEAMVRVLTMVRVCWEAPRKQVKYDQLGKQQVDIDHILLEGRSWEHSVFRRFFFFVHVPSFSYRALLSSLKHMLMARPCLSRATETTRLNSLVFKSCTYSSSMLSVCLSSSVSFCFSEPSRVTAFLGTFLVEVVWSASTSVTHPYLGSWDAYDIPWNLGGRRNWVSIAPEFCVSVEIAAWATCQGWAASASEWVKLHLDWCQDRALRGSAKNSEAEKQSGGSLAWLPHPPALNAHSLSCAVLPEPWRM